MINYKKLSLQLLFILFATFVSCKKQAPTVSSCVVTNDENYLFFSLKNYFCALTQEYEAKGVKVNKRVRFGDKTEAKEAMDIEWAMELASLIAADINHSAWYDKFDVDTIQKANGYSVLYQCNSLSIPVKELKVELKQDHSIAKIHIKTARKNALYSSSQSITFEPGVSYQVEGTQRTLFLSKTEFSIDADILQP